jgi:hypothetical protein
VHFEIVELEEGMSFFDDHHPYTATLMFNFDGLVGDGFRRASLTIADKLLESGRSDGLNHPMFFLLYHSLEVDMKRMITLANMTYRKEHSLAELWVDYKIALKQFEPNDPEDRWDWDNKLCILDRLVRELNRLSKRGFDFRYTDLGQFKNVNFSVENFKKVVCAIHTYMLATYDYCEHAKDQALDDTE